MSVVVHRTVVPCERMALVPSPHIVPLVLITRLAMWGQIPALFAKKVAAQKFYCIGDNTGGQHCHGPEKREGDPEDRAIHFRAQHHLQRLGNHGH